MTRSEEGYCELADGLIEGLLKFSDREGLYSTALFGASDLIEKPAWKELRDKYLEQYRLPFWVGRHFSLTTLDEVAAIADQTHAISATGSVEQLLLTHRSTSPNWWSFGTEARPLVDYELHPELSDYGAMYPSYTTTSLSHTLLSWLNRDYTRLDEPSLRLAFGGLMAPWAMVREDGAASMGFCPDMASSQRGLSARTGDIGFALAEFIRRATVWVLPSAERGFITFGGSVEAYPRDGKPCLRIVPWDGVGRRIVIRHMNVEITVEGAKIDSLELNADLRWMTLTLDNPNEAEQISISQRYLERAIYLKLSINPILFLDNSNSSGGSAEASMALTIPSAGLMIKSSPCGVNLSGSRKKNTHQTLLLL
jgi:hypothetical protein